MGVGWVWKGWGPGRDSGGHGGESGMGVRGDELVVGGRVGEGSSCVHDLNVSTEAAVPTSGRKQFHSAMV